MLLNIKKQRKMMNYDILVHNYHYLINLIKLFNLILMEQLSLLMFDKNQDKQMLYLNINYILTSNSLRYG